jgi:SAM-dependent methyltransferase
MKIFSRLRSFLASKNFFLKLQPQKLRDIWISQKLSSIAPGSLLLDAGCGSQRYRSLCNHLVYRAQDFEGYVGDSGHSIEKPVATSDEPYPYGLIDYKCDICSIPEVSESFDVILCTEVFEHLHSPSLALAELSRLLSPNGVLLLTVPCHTLRHMDPYHYFTGFTERWLEYHLPKNGLELVELTPVMDYYSVQAMEISRIISIKGFLSIPFLLPAFFFMFSISPSPSSVSALPYGYHVMARRSHG